MVGYIRIVVIVMMPAGVVGMGVPMPVMLGHRLNVDMRAKVVIEVVRQIVRVAERDG
jgi:hypothetical protein